MQPASVGYVPCEGRETDLEYFAVPVEPHPEGVTGVYVYADTWFRAREMAGDAMGGREFSMVRVRS